jgi:hypothetical protein
VTRKYPLDPLRRVREDAVDQKVRVLSETLRHVESAREGADRAERRKRELESALERTAGAERRRLARGELTAGDLARGAAWGVAQEIARAEHARLVEQARGRQAAAESRAAQSQHELASAKASAELVDKHHEKWQRALAAERALRDEEDAEQAHIAKLRRRGTP